MILKNKKDSFGMEGTNFILFYFRIYDNYLFYENLTLIQNLFMYIQGYPQWIRLQRRLYRILFCFFSFIYDSLQLKRCFFFANSLNKPIKDFYLKIVKFQYFQVVFTASFFVGIPVNHYFYRNLLTERKQIKIPFR